MYIKSSEHGFSLPELMITVVILGGIALVTMRLFENQTNNEALIRSRAEIQKAVSLIRSSLANPNNCSATFNSLGINNVAVSGANGVNIPAVKVHLPSTGGTKNLFTANTNYNHFDLDTINVRTYEDNRLKMDLNFKHKKKSSDGRNPGNWSYVRESLIFQVDFQSSTMITNCREIVSAANATAKEKFCKSLGTAATWNGATGKCTFNQMTCPFGQVVMKLNTFGGIQCAPIKDHIKLDTLFDVSYTCLNVSGKYRILYNGSGKLRVDCVL